jgi:hypothetical protein
MPIILASNADCFGRFHHNFEGQGGRAVISRAIAITTDSLDVRALERWFHKMFERKD